MTTSDKFFVIQAQDGVVGVEELRVENDLDSVGSSIEQLDSSDLTEDRVPSIVGHVVGGYGRKRVSLECKHSSLEEDLVF